MNYTWKRLGLVDEGSRDGRLQCRIRLTDEGASRGYRDAEPHVDISTFSF